jgi:phosphomannomutase
MHYLFDVDGTLTPSRGVIDLEFKKWFSKFMELYPVSFVTGSDIDKTVEQLGQDLLDKAQFVFNCSGNYVSRGGDCIYSSTWKCPEDLWLWLEDTLYKSEYPNKYGRNFEERPGLLNFSIVGREAQGEQRKDYFNWDKVSKERSRIADYINLVWPNCQASVGGETGIDIHERGKDKSSVLRYISGNVTFFGDRLDPAGNDYTLATTIIDTNRGSCYNVSDYNETWKRLKILCPNVSDLLANG